jgi:hypothetical protein
MLSQYSLGLEEIRTSFNHRHIRYTVNTLKDRQQVLCITMNAASYVGRQLKTISGQTTHYPRHHPSMILIKTFLSSSRIPISLKTFTMNMNRSKSIHSFKNHA